MLAKDLRTVLEGVPDDAPIWFDNGLLTYTAIEEFNLTEEGVFLS